MGIVRARGSLIPAVALYTRHEVQPAQELTFSYGQPNDGQLPGFVHQPCYCGSPECLGFMPLQQSD